MPPVNRISSLVTPEEISDAEARKELQDEFQKKYGFSTVKPASLDYLKLLAEAGEAGLTEAYVQDEFEKLGGAAGLDDGNVVLIAIDWLKFRTVWDHIQAIIKEQKRARKEEEKQAAKKGEELPPPPEKASHNFPVELLENELAAKKQWAREQGLTDTDILLYWGATSTDGNTATTPKRLDRFQELVCQHIHKQKEATDESSSDRSECGNTADNSSTATAQATEQAESGSATIHESESGKTGESLQEEVEGGGSVEEPAAEPAPTMVYQQICFSFEQHYSKYEMDCFLEDFKNDIGDHELSLDLLAAFNTYIKNCVIGNVPAPVPKEAPKHDPRLNLETGEVEVMALLASLNLTEMPTMQTPGIDEIVEEIGRRRAAPLLEAENRRRNCEAKCKQLQAESDKYKMFEALLNEHAASKLKRTKRGKNPGSISGSKTIIYENHCISFEQTGGSYIGTKSEFEKGLLALSPEQKQKFNIKEETKPVYDWSKLKPQLIKEGMLSGFPGISEYPVNDIGKAIFKTAP